MTVTRAETALSFRASQLVADLRRKRLRDRYIAVQFPDLAAIRGKSGPIIRLARELFDEGERRLGAEALILAVQESPQDKSLPLALLELAYLAQEITLFSGTARYFENHFPAAAENVVIARMGLHIAPRNAQFFGRQPVNAALESAYRIPGWSLAGSPSGDDRLRTAFRAAMTAGAAA